VSSPPSPMRRNVGMGAKRRTRQTGASTAKRHSTFSRSTLPVLTHSARFLHSHGGQISRLVNFQHSQVVHGGNIGYEWKRTDWSVIVPWSCVMKPNAFATVGAVAALALVLCPVICQAKDDCKRDDQILIEKLGGYNSATLKFKFESRVQKYSSTSFEYIWCIENESDNIGHFRWGTKDDESKYFDALVDPGKMQPTIRTDNSGIRKDSRIIKFTPKNQTNWQSISPDPQTIFYKKSAQLGFSTFELLYPTQVQLEERLKPFKTDDGIVDIARLSQNSDLFREFVNTEKRIDFWYIAVATLPTNKSTLFALEQGKYEKYNPRDFARLRITIRNQIELDSKNAPISRVSLSMTPSRANDEAGLASTASELGLTFHMQSSEKSFPKELQLEQPVAPRFSKLLLEQPTGVLSPASMRITIQAGKLGLFSFPFDLFVPGQRS